jgi:hypothetical protein
MGDGNKLVIVAFFSFSCCYDVVVAFFFFLLLLLQQGDNNKLAIVALVFSCLKQKWATIASLQSSHFFSSIVVANKATIASLLLLSFLFSFCLKQRRR